jgi:hypothetical protein
MGLKAIVNKVRNGPISSKVIASLISAALLSAIGIYLIPPLWTAIVRKASVLPSPTAPIVEKHSEPSNVPPERVKKYPDQKDVILSAMNDPRVREIQWRRSRDQEEWHIICDSRNDEVNQSETRPTTSEQPFEVKSLSRLAEQGNAAAQLDLGLMYRDGKGVNKDPKKAAKWFTEAAEQGFTPAQYHLA